MVLASIDGIMAKHMRDNSKMDIKMEWEFLQKMVINMKENLKIVSYVGKQLNTVKMETDMRENMKIGKGMEKDYIILRTAMLRKGHIIGIKG